MNDSPIAERAHAWVHTSLWGLLLVVLVCAGTDRLAAAADGGSDSAKSSTNASSVQAFRLTAGPMTHMRGVEVRAADAPVVQHSAPLGGVAASLQTLLLWIPDLEARLSLEADLRHAIGRSRRLSELTASPRMRYTRAAGRLRLSRGLGAGFHTGLHAGVAADSWVLTPNPSYTGSRYLGGEIGWNLRYEIPRKPVELSVTLSGLPVFDANVSGGRHGDGIAFGGRLDIRGIWRPFEPTDGGRWSDLLVETRLAGTRYRARFPGSTFDPAGATVVDRSASFTVSIGYRTD